MDNTEKNEKKLLRLRRMCFECESSYCAYNNKGECRFPLVKERKPKITEEDGCTDSSVDPWNM